MTPPDAPPQIAHPAAPPPRPATVAAVLAVIGALPMAYLGVLVWALGGLQSDGEGRGWALLPLAAAVLQVWGGVRLLRRRGWRLLAVGCLPAVAFAGWLLAQSAALGEPPPLLLMAMLLIGPVVAFVLVLTPQVRNWVAGRPGPE